MLIFTLMYLHRGTIQKMVGELQRHNQHRGTGLNLSQLAKSKTARASFVAQTVELRWLMPKFEKFNATQW